MSTVLMIAWYVCARILASTDNLPTLNYTLTCEIPFPLYTSDQKIIVDMLFAGWEVRIVKNCDRGLENAAPCKEFPP